MTEKKWQKKWADEKLFESNPNDKEKLFITVAFPYPSGAMHIGHGRTYTVPDVYARFKRMEGYNVLFPMAWHVTGAPVIGIADRIKRKDPWTLDLYENVHRVPKDELPKLEDPEYIVRYFSSEYNEVMHEMGYSIDWRREFRTIDPTYKKFIEWQITTLYEKGLIQKGEHPVKYCPNCDNPVGDHDLLEGEGVGVNELTLLKFKIDDKILVTATLRPETIVGATNIWLNPDVEYVLVSAEGENWVITKEAHYNLQHQIKDLEIISEINPNDLIGKMAINPFTGDELPIFPASFVSASYGSGVVFSEPADAPADYIALQDLKKNDELIAKYNLEGIVENVVPIPVCSVKGYGEIPAADIIERLGITDQNDEKLHEATNELYKIQHSKGTILDSIPGFGGKKVRFAREELKDELISKNMATIMYDFAERPVVCRCGNNCVVKIMDDQWFMKYSNPEWTEKTHKVLERETIIPPEVKNNFNYYIDWLDDWACSRKVGLGTRLPWDNQWLIEPLTDSTIYMSYYSIARFLKDMNPDDLNRAFFDKVYLNKDSDDITVAPEVVKEIQDEFNYWYPLDWRLSAKDLVGNHLSFLMFHHSAIFPEDKWPKGTVVFGMGLLEGNKMSSSKGNVILLKDAIEDYTADVVRLFLMASAEPWQDFDWREKEVLGTKRRLEWFREFAGKVEEIKGSALDLSNIEEVELTRTIDLWMLSQLNQHIKTSTEALEVFQTRKALQESLFLLKKDIDHYLYRVNHLLDKKDPAVIYVLSTVVESWIRLLAPFTPHTCEELWSKYSGEGFVSVAKWPEADESLISLEIEKSEELVQNLIKDINQIKKMVGEDAEKVHIYLAPDWKWDLYKIASEVGKPDIGQIMGRAIGANIYDDKKEIAAVAKKVGREMTKTKYVGKIDEAQIIDDALEYISNEVSSEVIVHTDDSYDPQNKARNAMPYKPAILIE
ncbi:MAG: leucine--tRNA ligase [Methanobrevibacter millerae]|uniref:Leucine--tRNA ligase n=1 Tax=Methanobrevibacter millerae TaxID=230361 RepID=A0A8T3VBX2_9EURY|nr:leucine--tRNA ligase [Methanobrevibacter millerae]MBE6505247.1 leucine--tRNA ligase [Methanobrevibacter millerae]